MPASMHNGLVTDVPATPRPQPTMRWIRNAPHAGLVIRWNRVH